MAAPAGVAPARGARAFRVAANPLVAPGPAQVEGFTPRTQFKCGANTTNPRGGAKSMRCPTAAVTRADVWVRRRCCTIRPTPAAVPLLASAGRPLLLLLPLARRAAAVPGSPTPPSRRLCLRRPCRAPPSPPRGCACKQRNPMWERLIPSLAKRPEPAAGGGASACGGSRHRLRDCRCDAAAAVQWQARAAPPRAHRPPPPPSCPPPPRPRPPSARHPRLALAGYVFTAPTGYEHVSVACCACAGLACRRSRRCSGP